MIDNRVLAMESISEGRRTLVLISLEPGVSIINPDATERPKHNLPIVFYLTYYYPKYSINHRFNWDKQILVE
jgi:hypothetical protein